MADDYLKRREFRILYGLYIGMCPKEIACMEGYLELGVLFEDEQSYRTVNHLMSQYLTDAVDRGVRFKELIGRDLHDFDFPIDEEANRVHETNREIRERGLSYPVSKEGQGH